MGKRLLETHSGGRWHYTSEIPLEVLGRFESALPSSMMGAEYLSRYQGTDDPLTRLEPDHVYPVRAATRFPIEENARAYRAREILMNYAGDPPSAARELRAILKASHDGYGAMGLGSEATDAFLDHLLEEPPEAGLIGGRISGGGSGGTVVVLLEKSARHKLKSMATTDPHGAIIF
jgi:L-arabinokinase